MPLMRRWIDAIAGFARSRDREAAVGEEWRLSAAILLLQVGQADGHMSEAERARFSAIARQAFALNPYEADELIDEAMEDMGGASDMSAHAAILKRHFEPAELHRFVEMLWLMGLANGRAGELEETVIWRIASLLGVPDGTMNAIRAAALTPQ